MQKIGDKPLDSLVLSPGEILEGTSLMVAIPRSGEDCEATAGRAPLPMHQVTQHY